VVACVRVSYGDLGISPSAGYPASPPVSLSSVKCICPPYVLCDSVFVFIVTLFYICINTINTLTMSGYNRGNPNVDSDSEYGKRRWLFIFISILPVHIRKVL